MRIWRYLANLLRSAFAVSVAGGAVLFSVAYPFSDAEPDDLLRAAIVVGAVALLTALLQRFRLVICVTLTVVAYFIGLVYAAEILFTPEVVDGYRTAVLTVAVFAAHGAAVGALIELVGYLHRVSRQALAAISKRTRLKIE